MGAGISSGGQILLYLCKHYVIPHTMYGGHAQVCKNYSAKIQMFMYVLKMPRACIYTSEDLHWRVVWLHFVRGLSYINVAQTPFKVCAEVPGSLSCHWKNGPMGPKEPEGT